MSKQSVLHEFEDLFRGIGVLPGTCQLHLRSDAIPVMNPPRRIPEALKSKLKIAFGSMVGD